MASIRKRGHGQWQVRVTRKGYPPQVNTCLTRAAAEAWAAITEGEMARGVFVSLSEAERTTLAELIDRYRDDVTPTKKNARDERRILGVLKEKFGKYSLASLQPKHVSEFRDDLKRIGRASSTINH